MARYGKEHREQTRQRVLSSAARAFKSGGLETVGIGKLMGQAGLTHGGFYAHFESKDALVAEALEVSLTATSGNLLRAAQHPPYGLEAVLRSYLSRSHRDHPEAESSCVLPTLAGEVARQPEAVRQHFTEKLEHLIAQLSELSPGEDEAEREQATLARLSGMVGALLLSRAVIDPALSDRILKATRNELIADLRREQALGPQEQPHDPE